MSPNTSLYFANPGEIDPRLIYVLGTNVKSTSSAIGQFGTGLKYAIAGILRLGGQITILSGPLRMEFSVTTATVRDKDFGFITMTTTDTVTLDTHEQSLGFTTDLGRHWADWMLYRELYCNALDEGGTTFTGVGFVSPQKGYTRIVVNCPELLKVHNNAGKWFLAATARPIAAVPGLEIYLNRGDSGYFYRGIRVGDLSRPSRFTYNILALTDLTEDRTMSEYMCSARIASTIFTSADLNEDMLTTIMHTAADPATFEHRLPWPGAWEKPSPTLIAVLTKNLETKSFVVPSQLMRACQLHLPRVQPQTLPLSAVQAKMVAKARDFLATIGITITAPIVVVQTLGHKDVLGLAEDNTIYLPVALFDRGTKYVASTLLEEHIHIELGYDDCSRDMQTWLFDKIISLLETIRAEPI